MIDAIENYEVEDNAVNPFLAFASFNAVQLLGKHKMLAPDNFKVDEGVIVPKGEGVHSEYKYTYLKDSVKSCRLFQTETVQQTVMKLDHNAMRLFIFIMCKIGFSTDRIRIDIKKYMDATQIKSRKTFYNSLNSLTKEGILSKYKLNIFWVNPNIIFNGDRIGKWSDKVNIIYKAKMD